MINFKSRLKANIADRKTNPCELYDSLDRAVDKGPLRPAQQYVLNDWFNKRTNDKDVIVKLHTGQGKTLIGLLMLLSKINQGKGPALYLCPNNYLVSQTCTQASQFGIPYCEITDDLPPEFINGKMILVTSIQRLFNGLTKFGIGTKSVNVGTILIDDAHTCIEAIRNACTIRLKKDEDAFQKFLDLFSPSLEEQGAGTFMDIKDGSFEAIQYVPYWAWHEKQREVIEIISSIKEQDNIKFTWPLIKDNLPNCHCVLSGQFLEISPSSIPLYLFGSFLNANQRIYMSATFFDDSFLIKSFEIAESSICNPLTFPNEKWAGEKMVLIPSLIHEDLERSNIVKYISELNNTKFGIVVLGTSFNKTKDWASYGCQVATKADLHTHLQRFKNSEFTKPLVIVNRYDGIDLPDQMCRILILDSKPFLGSLWDRYMQNSRSESIIIESKLSQTVEQGMGRAVRGEKDYCAVILIGPELIKSIHSSKTRKLFSLQTRTQIEIGLDVSNMAKEDIDESKGPLKTFTNLLNQLLRRDEGWKEFYVEKMNEMSQESYEDKSPLPILLLEKQAEDAIIKNNPRQAISYLQNIVDKMNISESEKGWYLQEMARITYQVSKTESNQLQIAAHKKNRYLLKPQTGMAFIKLEKFARRRIERICDWLKNLGSYSEVQLCIQEILGSLSFGTNAARFERALDQLGQALGFETQQPDKEWKEGPDNLWLVEDHTYFLFECKSEVELTRTEINKSETGQMNNSIAWFAREYGESDVTFFQIIPTKTINKAAGYNEDVQIIRDNNLRKLCGSVRAFFKEFEAQNFNDLSVEFINTLLCNHKLIIKSFKELCYSEKPKQL